MLTYTTEGVQASPMVMTKKCHYLAFDPLDDNYFASCGPPGDNSIAVWDRRMFGRIGLTGSEGGLNAQPVLDIQQAISTEFPTAKIWSLRYSGYKRGCFATLSDYGQLRYFEPTCYDAPSVGGTLAADQDQAGLWYMRRSDDLAMPMKKDDLGFAKANVTAADVAHRVITFDHAHPDHGVLTMHADRTYEMIPLRNRGAGTYMTPSSTIAVHSTQGDTIAEPVQSARISEELLTLDLKIKEALHESGIIQQQQPAVKPPLDRTSRVRVVKNARSVVPNAESSVSSLERHHQLMDSGLPHARLKLGDMLTQLDVHRRRCLEGYLFDCDRNKIIVKENPWLVAMWDTVGLLHDMQKDAGMSAADVNLSYLGVSGLWRGKMAANILRTGTSNDISMEAFTTTLQAINQKKKVPPWDGVKTARPLHRQLCLLICGFMFNTSKLKAKCMEIFDRGEHYKAIMVAICHSRKDIAIDLVKTASRSGIIEGVGLAAVIASESMSKEMQALCKFMADDAQDLYLKALLVHYVTGSWVPVVALKQLPLVYRIAIALKFLSDAELDALIPIETATAIATGDIEGVVLTGLAEDSIDLFQAYITHSGDIQTAVLATAFANRRFVDDSRWNMWKQTLQWQQQGWRAFIPRTKFTVQHNRMAVDAEGKSLIAPPTAQLTLRCNHCHANIARAPHNSNTNPNLKPGRTAGNISTGPRGPAFAAGTVCPRCGRHLPRCGICMLWLGTPAEEDKQGAQEGKLARFVYSCIACGHAHHAHHAKDWFARHTKCPVPDCQCHCGRR